MLNAWCVKDFQVRSDVLGVESFGLKVESSPSSAWCISMRNRCISTDVGVLRSHLCFSLSCDMMWHVLAMILEYVMDSHLSPGPWTARLGLCQMPPFFVRFPRWFCQAAHVFLRPLPSVDEQGSGGLHVASCLTKLRRDASRSPSNNVKHHVCWDEIVNTRQHWEDLYNYFNILYDWCLTLG